MIQIDGERVAVCSVRLTQRLIHRRRPGFALFLDVRQLSPPARLLIAPLSERVLRHGCPAQLPRSPAPVRLPGRTFSRARPSCHCALLCATTARRRSRAPNSLGRLPDRVLGFCRVFFAPLPDLPPSTAPRREAAA